MAFRRVDVPHDWRSATARSWLGGADERFAFAEGSRYDYIAGAFGDGEDRPAVLLLAKYEVTELQYERAGRSLRHCPSAPACGRPTALPGRSRGGGPVATPSGC